MSPISIITIMGVLAADVCKDQSIAECAVDSGDGCAWLPTSGECVKSCNRLNNTECNASPACYLLSGTHCTYVDECSKRTLENCYDGCGIEVGQNTCRNCSSAVIDTDCGRMSNCDWDGLSCGKEQDCWRITDPTLCMETGCIWRKEQQEYCSNPDEDTDLCQTSNTTNCIRYKNDLVPCSELTTRPLCMRQATCEWNSFSQSCVDADLCSKFRDANNCETVGCTFAMKLCTNAAAFTKCASISDKDNCNNQKTCAFNETNNASICEPVAGCEWLTESVCGLKPDCKWNPSSSMCGNSGRPCGELRMLCGGEKCKNMVRDPDMTEYSLFGSFFDGKLVAAPSQRNSLLKNGVPCVDCPICLPGYVLNVGATIQCGADGIGSFGQQVCVLPGDYSDGTGTPVIPDGDDDDGGNNIIVIVVVVVCALLVVIVLVLVSIKVFNKKNAKKHNLNDCTREMK